MDGTLLVTSNEMAGFNNVALLDVREQEADLGD